MANKRHTAVSTRLSLDEDKDIVPIYLEEVDLTSDLKVGLNRVQALHRNQDAGYRQHLLNAVGGTSAVELPNVSHPKKTPLPLYAGLVLLATVLVVAGW